MTTYNIFAENMPALLKLTEKMNKRAKRLSLEPISVRKVGEVDIHESDGITVTKMYTVEVDGQTPRLDGWEFVATIQHAGEAGNILRVLPDFEGCLPEQYRTADPGNCDHCRKFRRRNDTYIVKNGEAWNQVGSNCLQDFVRSDKIGAMAALCEMMVMMHEACEGFGEIRGERGEDSLVLESALAWAAEAMFLFGWVSRTKAYNDPTKVATVDRALVAMENSAKGRKCTWKCHQPCANHFTPSDKARDMAVKVMEWAPSWIEREMKRDQESDYIWNMKVVLANDVIAMRSYGLAASVLGAYQREMERNERIARERAVSTSEYIGTVGEKIVLDLTVKAFRFISTAYGMSTLITYHDDKGNVIKWFASGQHEPELETTEKLQGTITKQTEYNGVKETQINRVKPFVDATTKKNNAAQKKALKAEYVRLQDIAEVLWSHVTEGEESRLQYEEARDAANKAYRAWKV